MTRPATLLTNSSRKTKAIDVIKDLHNFVQLTNGKLARTKWMPSHRGEANDVRTQIKDNNIFLKSSV